MKKIVFLNAAKLDFDRKLGFASLTDFAHVTNYDESGDGEILERVEGQNIVVTKELPLGTDLIAQFPPTVELICEAGTGYNNIDIETARERGIAVCNVPSYSTEAVAQLVINFIMNFSSSMVRQQIMLQKKDFANFTDCLQLPHFELQEKTLGIIGGSGAIGQAVMKIARALGMEVLVYSRSPKTWSAPKVRSVSLGELLWNSDFVSIHCPLSPETKHLIDKTSLKQMKPSAFLINTARGPIVKETDLIEALQEGAIAGAALDVQDPEPPELFNPLFAMENVILTPHIGWKRLETRQRLIDSMAESIRSFIEGQPVNVVN